MSRLVSRSRELLVDREEVFIEHLVLCSGVAGWVIWADAELAVSGDIQLLTLRAAVLVSATPGEPDQDGWRLLGAGHCEADVE